MVLILVLFVFFSEFVPNEYYLSFNFDHIQELLINSTDDSEEESLIDFYLAEHKMQIGLFKSDDYFKLEISHKCADKLYTSISIILVTYNSATEDLVLIENSKICFNEKENKNFSLLQTVYLYLICFFNVFWKTYRKY